MDDWWAVEYCGKVYPGIVTEIQNKNFEVCAMVRDGSYWKWPSQDDKIFYERKQMKKMLQPPVMVNARNYWGATFPELG